MTENSKEFDPWGGSTGLIDDVDVVIGNAFFGYNSDYQEGQALLMQFEFIVDDPDTPQATQFYSCGGKWETNDRGATAVREDGKVANFNKNTNYYKWFNAALEAGAMETLKNRGTPFEAKTWVGLKFHVKRFSEEFTMRGESEKRTRETLLPTEFLGTVDAGAQPAPAQQTTQEAVPQAAAPTANNGEISGVLKQKLSKAAKEAGNLDSFLEAAFGIDGVDGNKEVENALEGFYAEVTA